MRGTRARREEWWGENADAHTGWAGAGNVGWGCRWGLPAPVHLVSSEGAPHMPSGVCPSLPSMTPTLFRSLAARPRWVVVEESWEDARSGSALPLAAGAFTIMDVAFDVAFGEGEGGGVCCSTLPPDPLATPQLKVARCYQPPPRGGGPG